MGTVASWIAATGEVLVILRYLCGAGSKDFVICKTDAEFAGLVERAPEGADIIVFRNRQLPLRGIAGEEFIKKATALVPDGVEYLIVRTKPSIEDDPAETGVLGDTHRDMFEDIRNSFMDCEIALGECPNYIVGDHADMISRAKGGVDGPR